LALKKRKTREQSFLLTDLVSLKYFSDSPWEMQPVYAALYKHRHDIQMVKPICLFIQDGHFCICQATLKIQSYSNSFLDGKNQELKEMQFFLKRKDMVAFTRKSTSRSWEQTSLVPYR